MAAQQMTIISQKCPRIAMPLHYCHAPTASKYRFFSYGLLILLVATCVLLKKLRGNLAPLATTLSVYHTHKFRFEYTRCHHSKLHRLNVRKVPIVSDDEFGDYVRRGEILLTWLCTPSLAPVEVRADSWVVSPSQLEMWGWDQTEDNDIDFHNLKQHAVEANISRIDTTYETGKRIKWKNNRDVDVDGKTYKASKAYYDNCFWPQSGIIHAADNRSPAFAIQDLQGQGKWDPTRDVMTKLNKWSDVVFVSWKASCGLFDSNSGTQEREKAVERVKGLRFIERHSVVNHPTRGVLRYVLRDLMHVKNGRAHKWPGVKVARNEHPEAFKGILGTPNLAGVVFLLLQHQKEFGSMKDIKMITIFDDASPEMGGMYSPSLWVELGDGDDVEVESSSIWD